MPLWKKFLEKFDEPIIKILLAASLLKIVVDLFEASPPAGGIALAVAPGGGLNEQIYIVRPDGSGLKRITEGGKENNRLSGWSGRLVRYSSNRRTPEALDAYVYDCEAGKTRRVAANPGIGTLTDVSRDGVWLADWIWVRHR